MVGIYDRKNLVVIERLRVVIELSDVLGMKPAEYSYHIASLPADMISGRRMSRIHEATWAATRGTAEISSRMGNASHGPAAVVGSGKPAFDAARGCNGWTFGQTGVLFMAVLPHEINA